MVLLSNDLQVFGERSDIATSSRADGGHPHPRQDSAALRAQVLILEVPMRWPLLRLRIFTPHIPTQRESQYLCLSQNFCY